MAAVGTVEIPVAVRAWARRKAEAKNKKKNKKRKAFTDLGPSRWTLVLDTESTTDPGQALRVGGYQLRYFTRLKDEGLFYEPSVLLADELETVRAYAAAEGLRLSTRERFVQEVFLLTAWKRRGLIVGHNVVFDLSRLSISHHPPQSEGGGRMRGGFSFKLCEVKNTSCVQVKRINSGGAFISLTIPAGVSPEARNRERGGRQKNHHGYFLDTATGGGALFGGRPTLKRLGELLKTKHQKGDDKHGKHITGEYLRYLRTDVQVTWECAVALRQRFESYQLPKRLDQIYSEASVGKAHLEKMGMTRFRALNKWPDQITATVLETYYGGRAECGIRKVPVPGVYTDFKSQYPTVFTLQDLHRFLIAQRVSYTEEDPEHVRGLLGGLTVDDLFDRDFWRRELPVLVWIAPDGDRLPTRARYNQPHPQGGPSEQRKGSYNVGVPLRCGGPAQWYTLADACASTLMTGKAPRILAVLRFQAHGIQDGLQPIDIAGNSQYRVDPGREDFIRRLVELRNDVRTKQKAAETVADTALAAVLESTQQGMKCTANGTAYGSAIELNPLEHRKKAPVTVHLPSGTSYQLHRERTEEPGRWFHPLIATLVASGGRLLLTIAMRQVSDLGGSYAFCDTDSLFIIATRHGKLIPCPGGQHYTPTGRAAIKALSWQQVQTIVDRFAALDPYHRPGHPRSILKIEDENYDPETGEQREIECLSLAAKRYGLFVRRPDGAPTIISSGDKKKRSEHGLGHLLPPNAPDPEISDSAWLDEWWEHLLHLELGFEDHPEPVWFDAPAVGRLTVTSQREIKAFATYNEGRAYAEQVKPWNFLITAHPAAHEHALPNGPRTLIAPFERDPVKRLAANWIDRDQPDKHPRRIHTSSTPEPREGSTHVLSYRDYFNQYRQHPEAKAIDPTDGKRCHTWTRGQLQPWHITATEQIRVGKESNRLTDTHQPTDDEDEQVIEYPAPTRKCRGCDLLVTGRRKWCSEGCRKRYGRHLRRLMARLTREGGTCAAPQRLAKTSR